MHYGKSNNGFLSTKNLDFNFDTYSSKRLFFLVALVTGEQTSFVQLCGLVKN